VRGTVRFGGAAINPKSIAIRDATIVDGKAIVVINQMGIETQVRSAIGHGIRIRITRGSLLLTVFAKREAFKKMDVALQANRTALVILLTATPPHAPISPPSPTTTSTSQPPPPPPPPTCPQEECG
jgi:hypothetical protein